MRWIYLSPHFDDVVLSCGGLIWEQTHSGITVEIWTICAGNPPAGPISEYAMGMHKIWKTGSAQETVELRRIEDQNAARRVVRSFEKLSQGGERLLEAIASSLVIALRPEQLDQLVAAMRAAAEVGQVGQQRRVFLRPEARQHLIAVGRPQPP